MIQLLDLGRSDLLAYRATDVLTDEDVRSATEAFDAALDHNPTVHLYSEVIGLRGFEVRALWLDLVYGLRHLGALRQIGRVALVTDSAWIRRIARIEARILPIGQVNVYGPDDRDEAQAWIREAPAVAYPVLAADPAAGWFDDDWLDDDLDDAVAMGVDPDALTPAARPRAPRFGHTVHRTHALLRDVAQRLGTPGTAPAYHALRAVLPALRDRLPAAEAADLAAQFTTIVRGLFYEGYRPGRPLEKVGRDAFLARVQSGLRDDTAYDAEAAVRAIGAVLSQTVSGGEWSQVLGALPQELRELFEGPVVAG